MIKEEKAIYDKIYREKNKERIKKYRQEHKKYFREYNKKYTRPYKKERIEYKKRHNKIYRLAHKKEFNIWLREYRKNIHNKLACNLRTRIRIALKGYVKSDTTMELVGCSVKFLRKYLEKQFIKGMLWKNYGKWHVDHIRPCASFDLRKKSEQKKCFHYTNLQPLWAKDNISKGNRC